MGIDFLQRFAVLELRVAEIVVGIFLQAEIGRVERFAKGFLGLGILPGLVGSVARS